MLNRKTCDFVGRMPVYTSAWQREGQRWAANFSISVMEKPLDKVRGWEEESSTPCLLTVLVMLHEWQREREREISPDRTSNATKLTEREREREGGRDISPDIAINAKMHRQKGGHEKSRIPFHFQSSSTS